MPRLLALSLVAAAVLALALTYLIVWPLRGSGPTGPFSARVMRAVDGDTLLVRLSSGERERVRVIGVDTPEDVAPGRPVQCWSRRAAAYTRGLVEGRLVVLTPGRERTDRYGRTLAYVARDDGVSLEEALLRGGYARTLAISPNVDRAAHYAALERVARAAGRGLWGACPDAASWADDR